MGVKKCFMVGGGGLRGELDEAGVDVVEVEGVVDGEEGFKALKLDPQVCKQTPPPPPNEVCRDQRGVPCALILRACAQTPRALSVPRIPKSPATSDRQEFRP